jgi:hypothetical protein
MSEDNGSHLAVLATQPENPQETTHIAPIPLTYTEAKLYAFAQAEHWRQLTIADVNDMYYDNPYVNLWIEDDTVQIALSVTRPNIKRMLVLVKKS